MISLIVPIYNTEKYLKACLDSILNQTFGEFEVIMVNDGSTDNSEQICKSYLEKDSRFKYYAKENEGVTATWQYGVEKSIGEYIAFLDSDDKLSFNCFEEINEVVNKFEPDMIYYNFHKETAGKFVPIISRIDSGLYKDNVNYIKKGFLVDLDLVPSRCNKAIKSNIIKDIYKSCDRRVTIGDDIAYSLLCVDKIKSFYYLKKELFYYNQNDVSMVHKYNPYYKESYKILYSVIEPVCGESKAGKIYFDNIKFLIQMANFNDYKFAKSELKQVFNDEFTVKIVKSFKPANARDKILKFLILNKQYLALRILSKINAKNL